MRRPIVYTLAAALVMALAGSEAKAGSHGEWAVTLKAKAYGAFLRLKDMLVIPLPAIGRGHACTGGHCIHSWMKRLPCRQHSCINPIRSPRDFFMLR